MCILQQEADSVGVSHGTQCIHQTAAGFGVQTDRAPFDTLSTAKRVSALRQMQANVTRAHKSGDMDEAKKLTQDAYYQLRLAWERGIEEILFRGVVTRFGEGISTQPLKGVVVEDADYATIEAGMTRSSKFAHDSAARAQFPTPHPDELINDIEILETWRKLVVTREADIKKRRA